MITKNRSHYLKFLAQGYNTLLVSSKHYKEYDRVEQFFDTSIQRDMSQNELENFIMTLISNRIDIVLLDYSSDHTLAAAFYKKVKGYEKRIIVIAILPKETTPVVWEMLDEFDAVLLEDFDIYELKEKLTLLLSLSYTIKSIGRRDIKIDSGSSEMNMSLDRFFDIYESKALFIVDELVEFNKSLKSGDLSPELIKKISQKFVEIANIFSKNEKVADIAVVFKELANYLSELDLASIKPESLYGFDYFCYIINDTNTYIMDMFVDKIFKDTYIIKHSLENNLTFIKNILKANKADSGELEFFNEK